MKSKQIKILLIEDDPADAELVQGVLSRVRGLSLCVEWCDRLSTGLKRFYREPADILLLDLSPPDPSGGGARERARTDPPGPPIILPPGGGKESAAKKKRRGGEKK
ncbi:MAG: hypothetical protein MPW13_12940 [Candidatus Manganitrophus sp.]|nr:hypothetical protein [Candidatus Manganitrophus sp.]